MQLEAGIFLPIQYNLFLRVKNFPKKWFCNIYVNNLLESLAVPLFWSLNEQNTSVLSFFPLSQF